MAGSAVYRFGSGAYCVWMVWGGARVCRERLFDSSILGMLAGGRQSVRLFSHLVDGHTPDGVADEREVREEFAETVRRVKVVQRACVVFVCVVVLLVCRVG